MATTHLLDSESGLATCGASPAADGSNVTSQFSLASCEPCKAGETLVAHRNVWDMPTFAEQHPEMLAFAAERWDVVFPEDFSGQVYVVTKATGAMRKMGTTDVREALETLLAEAVAV